MIYLDEDIANHPKILRAGAQLGPNGGGAVLALFVACIAYARKFGTDGFIPSEFLAKCNLIRDANSVARVMAHRDFRLLHKVAGGYRIHDYDKWNLTAREDKVRRDRERLRKARYRAAHKPTGDAGQPRDTTPHITNHVPHHNQGHVPHHNHGTSASPVRSAAATTVVPTEEQRPDGRDPVPSVNTSPAAQALSRQKSPDENFAVLVRLTHGVMDDERCGDPTKPDLIEAVKRAAARARVEYHPAVLARALRSAGTQRLIGPRLAAFAKAGRR